LKPLIVNPEYRDLMPCPTDEEYKALEESIVRKSEATEPIIINKDDVILDGHTRYAICIKHGCFYRTDVRDFESSVHEKIFVIESNIIRRHLSTIQKAQLAMVLEPLYSEQAKQRQEATQLIGNATQKQDVDGSVQMNLTIENKGQARDQAAKVVGLSPTTYHRAKTVLEKAPEKLRKEVQSGKKSVSRAYKEIKTAEKKREPVPVPELPTDQYNVIYADPPWRYEFSETKTRSIETHYPSMSLKDICDMKIPSTENAILYLWATNPKLEEALQVVKAWGFTYKTNMVWVKDKIGMGYWFRGQHELLLTATKGTFSPPESSIRRSGVLVAPRRKHSQKPDEVYEIIESYFPQGKYLELFSREQRDGWTMWGYNESTQ